MLSHFLSKPLLCSLVFVFWFSPQILSQSDASLVAFWNFNEGSGTIVHDSSGHSNDGAINGAAWIDGFPLLGKALYFDGLDDNVIVPSSASLCVTNAITISLWFKCDSTIQPGYPYYYNFVSKWHGTGDQARTGYLLALNTYSTGQLRLALGFGNDEWAFPPSIKNTWDGGQWYYVAATYDPTLPSGNIKYYVNGILDAQHDENRLIAANTLPLYINIDPYELWHPGNAYFPGVIDKVIIYNRALSQEQITADFKGFVCGDINSSGTINALDVTYLINYLYKHGPAPNCE